MNLQRGKCPVCGENRAVTTFGRMRQHRGDVWMAGQRLVCAGTGLLPMPAAPAPTVHEGGTAREI